MTSIVGGHPAMSAAARPKRPAESFNLSNLDGHASKKPRFDVRNPSALAPDDLQDDAVLEADVIGSRGHQVRRSAVNIDGYDSDSDNDNFDQRAAARAKLHKQTPTQAEDQDDMFADLEDDYKDGDHSEDDPDDKAKKKRAVRFLDQHEIEGQVTNSKSGGHVSADFNLSPKGKQTEDPDSSTDSEVDDAVRASTADLDQELGAGSKKSHAPKLDAFNMQAEQDEGRFDDQGNFVRKAADPDAVHDMWMEGISKKDIKAAKEAADKRDQDRRNRNLQDDSKSDLHILQSLIPLLDPGETILEALARLAKPKLKDNKPKWQTKQKNKKQPAADHDSDISKDQHQEAKRRQVVEDLTAAADLLLTRGQTDIYDAERELLVRQYNRASDTPWQDAPRQDATQDTMWEYKWIDARDHGTVNGPYDTTTMRSWNNAGYFGDGVVFRQVGHSSDPSWSRVLPV